MRTRKRKPHIALILAVSLVWLILSAGSNVALSAWQPPIGIPRPEFGIEETYRMYDNPANRNPSLTYTQNVEGGYYTHYVDNNNVNSTDTDNPYGSVATPRETIPTTLAEGSIVEIHSLTTETGTRYVTANGSVEKPIFVRGYDSEDMPLVQETIVVKEAYSIWENLEIYKTGRWRAQPWLGSNTHHVALRNSEVYGDGVLGGSTGITIVGEIGNLFHNIVIYNNHIHHRGDVEAEIQNDVMGVAVGGPAEDIWIVDNHIHHMSGDSIQMSGNDNNVQRVYIGRNIMHDDRENAIDLKNPKYVVVSENEIYGYEVCSSSSGEAIVARYDSDELYILFNKIHDSVWATDIVSTGQVYLIGNVVYDTAAGMKWSVGGYSYVVNNNLYNITTGCLNGIIGEAAVVVNNILVDVNDLDGSHLRLTGVGRDSSTVTNNIFYQQDGSARIYWGEMYTLAEFQAATSKGEDCLEADPLFVDAVNNDFHLQSTSPAIDAGTSSGVVQQVFDRFQQLYGIDIRKDIEGRTRPLGSAWDIGAYEYSGPTADAGPDQNVKDSDNNGNEQVTLDASGSSDPDGYIASYVWTKDGAELAVGVSPEVTLPVGQHTIVLTVTDNEGLSDTDTVVIVVKPANEAPTADAGPDQAITDSDGDGSEQVTLDGSGSTDPDGTIQSYVWSEGGTQIATGVYPTATLSIGQHTITFTVTDDGGLTDTDTVVITVNEPSTNQPPSANAGADQTVIDNDGNGSEQITLDGSGSTDPDGTIQSYVWSEGGTEIATGENPAVTLSVGEHTITLTVTDNGGLTDTDTVIIMINPSEDGNPPTVTNCSPAAGDIQVPLNSLIILHVTDAGIGVKASSVIIRLDGDIIYTGGDTYYDSATGTCRRIGTIADYTYAYQSSQTFDFDESKTVTVNATDLGGIAMTEESYSFRTEMRSFGQNKQVDSTVEGLDKANPSTARDSNGNIWAVWHAGQAGSRDIYVAKLSVNEEYFGDINKIRGSTSDQCNPVIAIGSDNKLYVAWQDNRQADDNNQGDWDIYISTSDDGMDWPTETRVNDPNIGNQINPAIVIDGQSPNQAHVVWQDDHAYNQDIYIATSSDGFVTTTVSQITSHVSDQVEPAVAADSANTIYVVWTDMRNGSSDIYGAASNNWTNNVAIVSNTNNQSSPAIAAESARSILHLLWVDDTDPNGSIFYAATTDGLQGPLLVNPNVVDEDERAYVQREPTIVVTGSTGDNLKVFACWQDWRNVAGTSVDTDLYFAELSSGSGTNVFVGDNGSNTYQGEPVIGIDEYDHPYLIWADNRSVNTDIYYAGSTFIEPVALASDPVTASASGSTTVGTDPQAITTIDDVSVVVPAGALATDATITLAKLLNPPELPPGGFGICYDFGPSGLEFNAPVTITIPHHVNDCPGLPIYRAYWYDPLIDPLIGRWSPVGGIPANHVEISPTLHAVTFETTHFTYFGVGAIAGGGGGGGGGGCSVSASGEGNIVEFIIPYIGLAVVMVILKMRDARYRKARNMTTGKC